MMRVEYEVPRLLPPDVRDELVRRFGIRGAATIIIEPADPMPATIAYDLDHDRLPELLDIVPHLQLVAAAGEVSKLDTRTRARALGLVVHTT